MRKGARKFLKWFSVGVLSVLGALSLLAAWVVFHPEFLVNPKTLEWAGNFARKNAFFVEWQGVDSKAESLSLFRKRFMLRFENLCVGRAKEPFQSCFHLAHFEFVMDFSGRIPALTSLGPVRLTGGVGTIDASGTEAPDEEAGQAQGQGEPPYEGLLSEVIPDILEQAELGRLWIDYERLQFILSPEQTFSAGVRLSKRRSPAMAWDLRLFALDSPYINDASARFRFTNPAGTWRGLWTLSGDIEGAIVGGGGRLRADLVLRETARSEFAYDIDGRFGDGKKTITARAKGKISSGEIAVRMLSGEIENWIPGIRKITVDRCNIRAIPGSFLADCPVRLNLRAVPKLGGAEELALPVSPGIRIRANLKTAFPPDPANVAEGSVDLELEPAATEFLSGGAAIRAKIAGVPTEFPRDWRLDTEIKAELRLNEFRRLAAALSPTNFAIPAPLNALDGQARLAVAGTASLREGRIPVRLQTQLDSRGQKFDIDAAGELAFDTEALSAGRIVANRLSPRLELKILLTDVRLVMPRLQLRAPPRFLPDPRILRPEENRQRNAFKYRINIQTPEVTPVRLVSNLSKRTIPIHLNLTLSDSEPMHGDVRVANFPLELFRRNASVQHVTFHFSPKREKTRLDGVLKVSYTDYRVRVLLLGSVEEPRIQLTSDPPLPERQLLSVLLFGRPLEELDPLQSESVGNARAALADSALNLASLYFLAATPIESFGYDPNSGLFSAKLRLGEGTSLNVGAEAGEISQIGIRRRLSRFWTITTTVGSAQEHDSSVTAFLEWVNRY